MCSSRDFLLFADSNSLRLSFNCFCKRFLSVSFLSFLDKVLGSDSNRVCSACPSIITTGSSLSFDSIFFISFSSVSISIGFVVRTCRSSISIISWRFSLSRFLHSYFSFAVDALKCSALMEDSSFLRWERGSLTISSIIVSSFFRPINVFAATNFVSRFGRWLMP